LHLVSFQCDCRPRQLLASPTRRSSDLGATSQEVFRGPPLPAVAGTPEGGGDVIGGRRCIAVEGCVESIEQTHGRRFPEPDRRPPDRKSTRLNSSHQIISYAVFCLKKKT